jgi:membrane protein DedA with SNARE-associated domain
VNLFNEFVQWVSGAWWTYPLVFAVSAIDAFFPLVPSEATVITAGVVAGAGGLSLPLLIFCAALGAIVGDNICYGLGSWLGESRARGIFARNEKSRRAFDWASRQVQVRGFYLIVVARFIPGGRTAVTFSCGFTHAMRWRRFIAADIVAGLLWASYAALLGYWGGKRFENQPWKGLLVAFAIAVAASGVIELARRLRARGAAPEPE